MIGSGLHYVKSLAAAFIPLRLRWSRFRTVTCYQPAERHGTPGNYVNGANIAGFLQVAKAIIAQGVV